MKTIAKEKSHPIFGVSEKKEFYKTKLECENCGWDFEDIQPRLKPQDFKYMSCPNCFRCNTLAVESQEGQPITN